MTKLAATPLLGFRIVGCEGAKVGGKPGLKAGAKVGSKSSGTA